MCPCHLLLEKCCIRLNGFHRAAVAAAARASLWGYTLTLHCFYHLPLWHFHFSSPCRRKKKAKTTGWTSCQSSLCFMDGTTSPWSRRREAKGGSQQQQPGRWTGGSSLCFLWPQQTTSAKNWTKQAAYQGNIKGSSSFLLWQSKYASLFTRYLGLEKKKTVHKWCIYLSNQTAKLINQLNSLLLYFNLVKKKTMETINRISGSTCFVCLCVCQSVWI